MKKNDEYLVQINSIWYKAKVYLVRSFDVRFELNKEQDHSLPQNIKFTLMGKPYIDIDKMDLKKITQPNQKAIANRVRQQAYIKQ